MSNTELLSSFDELSVYPPTLRLQLSISCHGLQPHNVVHEITGIFSEHQWTPVWQCPGIPVDTEETQGTSQQRDGELYRRLKKTTGRETASFRCVGHTWVCQSNQHLTPAIRKKLIPVALRQSSISLWELERPVPKQCSWGTGSSRVWGHRECQRRKCFLAAAANQHPDASPKQKTLAKEKHRWWTISKGALEMLSL